MFIRWFLGAKPFSCQFCGRAFRQRSQQLGHETTHAGGLGISSHLAVQNHNGHGHIKFEGTLEGSMLVVLFWEVSD